MSAVALEFTNNLQIAYLIQQIVWTDENFRLSGTVSARMLFGGMRFAEGWQKRYNITYSDLQIVKTGEKLTAAIFAKYLKVKNWLQFLREQWHFLKP